MNKDMLITDTVEFRKSLLECVEHIVNKRKSDRMAQIYLIIGAIGTILAGSYIIFQLKFAPVEKQLEKVEMKLDIVEAKVKDKEELAFMIRTLARDECEQFHHVNIGR